VAGYALTFSPVKSVSVLWALAPLEITNTIELCHHRAVADALVYLQDNAAFTRLGPNGANQVNTDGFLAAQFVQHGKRAEDPNLCTLVAVSNKVRALSTDGIPRWLALDGQHLYKQNVAASELYNTRVEAHLIDMLGLSFTERAATEHGRRTVREITGISADLCKLLSSRRNKIKPLYDELVAGFQLEHDREPTTSEESALSQRAAFETRGAKPKPCPQAQQRVRWRSQAIACLGGQAELDAMLAEALTAREQRTPLITPEWIQAQAAAVIETVSNSNSTVQRNHVFAEAQRRVRAKGVGFDRQVAVAITDTAFHEPNSIEHPRSGHEDR
jgi:conjugative relaxase-like TrwC/TraI family protein